jgi:RNA polymerase sigma-70 factor, ECF subfamily
VSLVDPPELDEGTRWAIAAQDGDPGAAAAFIRSTQAEVWRFVAGLVDTATADDLTQETYLRAFRALASFQARSSVRTWLFGIARRVCADHLREVMRGRRLLARAAALHSEPTGQPDPASAIDAAQLLARLSPDRREAFVLTQILGLSYEEAARSLDIPIGTVRSRVARARMDLVSGLHEALTV